MHDDHRRLIGGLWRTIGESLWRLKKVLIGDGEEVRSW